MDAPSIAERRARRQIRLPVRYRDQLPEGLPPLDLSPSHSPVRPAQYVPPAPPSHPSIVAKVQEFFKTRKNTFGLFRRYRSESPPIHDPEALVELDDLAENPVHGQAPEVLRTLGNQFYPYPNENSFRIGNWYWTGSAQKSKQSLRELIDIVGDPNWKPGDVRHTRWDNIDAELGRADPGNGANDWMDEDTGWRTTPIEISVPFHRRAKNPGPKSYTVGELHHRSLVAIIREKLKNRQDDEQFHYEPYELFWEPSPNSDAKVRVHGKLYTSPAFLEAHAELQDSPGEPGCSLPRVVAAMMFWSDATHLTSFGDAKLWPCYLFFGNESKYCRCKPTCKLCNHVAYLNAVSC